jgi:hypothetical protein
VPVFPRNSTIKDILLYRPYTPGETVRVEVLDQDSERLGVYQVMTNKMHSVYLPAGGQVVFLVSTDVEELVVFYK